MLKALRHYWRQPEHFYWLTSFLAAREAQSSTCRLIALFVAILGGVPLAMLLSPAGPHQPVARGAAVAVAIACAVMAIAWLRQRWPSRTQSGAFVVTLGVAIAVSALSMSDPRAGLVWVAAFAVLGGYIALFHTVKFILVNLALAAATTVELAIRLSHEDLVLAVAALCFVLAANVAVPFASHLLLYALDIDVQTADIDPLTGLLNRDAFDREAGHVIARSRDDDQRLVIVVIDLDNLRLLCETDGEVACERARVAIAQTLRETTRHNALVAHVGDDEFLIADTFSSTDSFPLVERVRKAIAATPPRVTASIGVVSTPMRGLAACPPQDLLDELITIGTMAMYDARRAGGNQARYSTCDRPSALNNANPGSVDDF
jgi:diguanylate cyclase (GGDEF)-like protein